LKNLAEKLKPGPKLALLLASVVMAIYFNNLILLASLNTAIVAACLVFSSSFRDILSIIKRIAIGFPFLVVIYILSEYGAAKGLRHAVVSGVGGAAVFILKIHFVLWVNLLIVHTSEPQDIVRTLRKMRVPRELCIMIMIILRFFPVMFDEAVAIYQAQCARGFKPRRMLNPANWLPLSVPLIVVVMKKSQDLAIVLELKGMFDENPHNPDRTQSLS
jgi:cobalt/nickel transport system permease protein